VSLEDLLLFFLQNLVINPSDQLDHPLLLDVFVEVQDARIVPTILPAHVLLQVIERHRLLRRSYLGQFRLVRLLSELKLSLQEVTEAQGDLLHLFHYFLVVPVFLKGQLLEVGEALEVRA